MLQHAPGVLVGNDKVPEFEAKTLPPGTAPADRTFKPQNENEVPPIGMDQGDELDQATDTIGGTTSADVHTGLGHPGSGMTSQEIRHDGEKGRKNPGKSLEGVGAATREFKTVDERDPDMKHHRALDNDEAEVGRGTVGGAPAEDREPVSAEQVASERHLPRDTRVYGDK